MKVVLFLSFAIVAQAQPGKYVVSFVIGIQNTLPTRPKVALGRLQPLWFGPDIYFFDFFPNFV